MRLGWCVVLGVVGREAGGVEGVRATCRLRWLSGLVVSAVAATQVGCGLYTLTYSRYDYRADSSRETIPGPVRTKEVEPAGLEVAEARVADDTIIGRLVIAPAKCADVRTDTARVTKRYESALHGSRDRMSSGTLWLFTAVDAVAVGGFGTASAVCFGDHPPFICKSESGDGAPAGWLMFGLAAPFALGLLLDLYQHGANLTWHAETSDESAQVLVGVTHSCGVATPVKAAKAQLEIGDDLVGPVETDGEGHFAVAVDSKYAEALRSGDDVAVEFDGKHTKVGLSDEARAVLGSFLANRAAEMRTQAARAAAEQAEQRRREAAERHAAAVREACASVGGAADASRTMYVGEHGTQLRSAAGETSGRAVEPGIRVATPCLGKEWVVVTDSKGLGTTAGAVDDRTSIYYAVARDLVTAEDRAKVLLEKARQSRKRGQLSDAHASVALLEDVRPNLSSSMIKQVDAEIGAIQNALGAVALARGKALRAKGDLAGALEAIAGATGETADSTRTKWEAELHARTVAAEARDRLAKAGNYASAQCFSAASDELDAVRRATDDRSILRSVEKLQREIEPHMQEESNAIQTWMKNSGKDEKYARTCVCARRWVAWAVKLGLISSGPVLRGEYVRYVFYLRQAPDEKLALIQIHNAATCVWAGATVYDSRGKVLLASEPPLPY